MLAAAVGLGVGGCDEKTGEKAEAESADQSENGAESSGRVNAVKAKEPEEAPPPEKFCDIYKKKGEAEDFEFPPLKGEAPGGVDGWRWVNLWATWCAPCIEEMPRLAKWEKELADKGLADVAFISTDMSADKVKEFRREHQDLPDSALIDDPAAVKPWLKSMGLGERGSLPVHVFVDPDNKVRCMRAGGIGDDERRAVVKLLQSQ